MLFLFFLFSFFLLIFSVLIFFSFSLFFLFFLPCFRRALSLFFLLFVVLFSVSSSCYLFCESLSLSCTFLVLHNDVIIKIKNCIKNCIIKTVVYRCRLYLYCYDIVVKTPSEAVVYSKLVLCNCTFSEVLRTQFIISGDILCTVSFKHEINV